MSNNSEINKVNESSYNNKNEKNDSNINNSMASISNDLFAESFLNVHNRLRKLVNNFFIRITIIV